jgi:hypothetical protein
MQTESLRDSVHDEMKSGLPEGVTVAKETAKALVEGRGWQRQPPPLVGDEGGSNAVGICRECRGFKDSGFA